MYRVYTITIYDIRKYTIRVYTTTALVETVDEAEIAIKTGYQLFNNTDTNNNIFLIHY